LERFVSTENIIHLMNHGLKFQVTWGKTLSIVLNYRRSLMM